MSGETLHGALPSAKRLALLCGVSTRAAYSRLWRYRHGAIDETALYAGRKPDDSRKVDGGRCPVTGGLPTRMSAAAFAGMCEANLKECRFGVKRGPLELRMAKFRFGRCEWCEGKRAHWPGELEEI